MQLNNIMIWDTKKLLLYAYSFLFAVIPVTFSGCGILNPAKVDESGYYIRHYRSCGPDAIGKALDKFNRNGRRVSRERISQDIQDNSNAVRRFAGIVDRRGTEITLPSEVIDVCKDYGYSVTTVDNLDTLDPSKDIALVLVRKGITDWHWLCYPVDVFIDNFYGEGTVVSEILLLKPVYRLLHEDK